MTRLLFWLILLYLGWQAYKIVKHATFFHGEKEVGGKPENPGIEIDENDIQDAEFKDLKK